MAERVRLLNEDGTRLFREYIDRARKGSAEAPPLHLLTDDATSILPDFNATIEDRRHASRTEFGRYLVGAFEHVGRRRLSREAGLWNWLALRYFDQLCPLSGSGERKLLATGH